MPNLHQSNRLLLGLSPWGYTRIEKQLETRTLAPGDVLCDVQATTEEVHFLTSGLVSLHTLTEAGSEVPVALVNADGALGIWLALGLRRSPWRAEVRTQGASQVMPAALFADLLREEPDFQRRMIDYGRELFALGARALACAQLHDASARTARWLLEWRDWAAPGSAELESRQLASLIGSTETGVGRRLQAFPETAIIVLSENGRIRIIDPAALESAACECYVPARLVSSGARLGGKA